MGWYQSTICSIDVSKTNFRDIADIEERINNIKEEKNFIKSKLIQYAITNPKDYQDKEESFDETLESISESIRDYINSYTDLCDEHFQLCLLKENWDKRSGDYTYNPDLKENYKKFVREIMLPELEHQKYLKEERENHEYK